METASSETVMGALEGPLLAVVIVLFVVRLARGFQTLPRPVARAMASLRRGHYGQAVGSLAMLIDQKKLPSSGQRAAECALAYALAAAGAAPPTASTPTKASALDHLLRARAGADAPIAARAMRTGELERHLRRSHDRILGRHGARVRALLWAFAVYRHDCRSPDSTARLHVLLRLASPARQGEFDYLTASWPELATFVAAHERYFKPLPAALPPAVLLATTTQARKSKP